MRHGSLFSGIGGFDYSAQLMGWDNVMHCEINPFGRQVLKYYWPNATSYEDIKTTDFSVHRGAIDILTGGFPCQPYSQAGKRLGKEDDRHLWPEMLRAIREISPRWVVGENVRGLTNWNGGLVFDEVQADLEFEGYEITPFLLPAASVGAPHRRDRIWFVANTSMCDKQRDRLRGPSSQGAFGGCNSEIPNWEQFPTQSPVCSGNDGISSGLLRQRIRDDSMGVISEKEIDKILSKAATEWRIESIKAGGNAVVPQVVLQIFKAIEQYELS